MMIRTGVCHTPVNKRQKGSGYKFDFHYERCGKAARIRADKKGGYAHKSNRESEK
ncbi:hypothetical protein GPL02_13400 [Clostridium sp. MCC334]|nr:hypothetical protein [Clostridium sp. MCC334]